MDNETLIRSIKQLCQNRNISVSQLENDLGFSSSLISRWKDNNPNIDRIIDIADYFHVSIDEVVGYDQNINDDFIKELYEQTSNGSISWKLVEKNNITEYPKIKLYNKWEDELPHDNYYNEETHKEVHYVIRFNKGYIIMYTFYAYKYILHPEEMKLFIQPSYDSYLVEQDYSSDILLKLWIKILNSLGDEAPDEVKAEDFKMSFLNEAKKVKESNKISTNKNNYRIINADELKKKISSDPKNPKNYRKN